MDLVDKMCSRSDQFTKSDNTENNTENSVENMDNSKKVETAAINTSSNKNIDYIEREGISSINVLKSKMEQGRRKRFQRQRAVIKKEEAIDIITSFDQIDGIDDGKPWKKLDAWLRKKKLLAYIDNNNICDEDRVVLLEKLKKGGLNSSKKVNYDSVAGKIIAIS